MQYFCVTLPLIVRPLPQMDVGSLTCAQLWVRAVHTPSGKKGGRGVRQKQICTQVDSEGQKKLSLTLDR